MRLNRCAMCAIQNQCEYAEESGFRLSKFVTMCALKLLLLSLQPTMDFGATHVPRRQRV